MRELTRATGSKTVQALSNPPHESRRDDAAEWFYRSVEPASAYVRIYDVETRVVTEIPASELSPEMVAFELPEIGRVFIRTGDRNKLSTPSAPFISVEWDHIARIVWSMLPKVMPEEKFIQGLRTDGWPVAELKEWMLVAALCQVQGPASPEEIEEVSLALLHIVLAARNSGRDALYTIDYTVVPKDFAEHWVNRALTYTEEEFSEFWREKVDLNVFERLLEAERRRHH